jgi:hypothetical protein
MTVTADGIRQRIEEYERKGDWPPPLSDQQVEKIAVLLGTRNLKKPAATSSDGDSR